MRETLVGFSTESIRAVLGGSLELLITAIKNGTLRGLAGFVSCTTLPDSEQDVQTERSPGTRATQT